MQLGIVSFCLPAQPDLNVLPELLPADNDLHGLFNRAFQLIAWH